MKFRKIHSLDDDKWIDSNDLMLGKFDINGKAIRNKHIEKQSKEDISNMKEYQDFMDLLK